MQMLQLPEESSVYVEKDDDLDFIEVGGRKTLASLKHKALGERLTDLSTDFWKSVRIWLTRYRDAGRADSTHLFYLFTTNEISESSFLKAFLPGAAIRTSHESLVALADAALNETESKRISQIGKNYTR